MANASRNPNARRVYELIKARRVHADPLPLMCAASAALRDSGYPSGRGAVDHAHHSKSATQIRIHDPQTTAGWSAENFNACSNARDDHAPDRP
jgi:hypothetical protein